MTKIKTWLKMRTKSKWIRDGVEKKNTKLKVQLWIKLRILGMKDHNKKISQKKGPNWFFLKKPNSNSKWKSNIPFFLLSCKVSCKILAFLAVWATNFIHFDRFVLYLVQDKTHTTLHHDITPTILAKKCILKP